MIRAVITDLTNILFFATKNDCSIIQEKLFIAFLVKLNACIVLEDNNISEAIPELSAILFWLSLLSFLNILPIASMGIIIIGTNNNTIKESLIEVRNIKKRPPNNSKVFLKASEIEDETTDKISVVSVVILDNISPVNKRS